MIINCIYCQFLPVYTVKYGGGSEWAQYQWGDGEWGLEGRVGHGQTGGGGVNRGEGVPGRLMPSMKDSK